jgi:Mrp family chromosome partitioning ATPase
MTTALAIRYPAEFMSDLSSEMAALAERLGPAPGAVARLVQFVAPEPGEGASTLARAFAMEVAKTAVRPVWLVELDLMKGEQHGVIGADAESYGRLGDPTRASPNHAMFFTVTPKVADEPGLDASFLAAYGVGRSRLHVTRFRRERLSPGQTPRILPTADYWEAIAAHSEYVVVDAPAWSRSKVAGVVAPFMDVNLLVVSADKRNPEAADAAKRGMEAAGGRWSGVVVNRSPKRPPKLIRSLVP